MIKKISKKTASIFIVLSVLLIPISVFAQKKTYETIKILKDAPHIDGLLNDEAWSNVEWSDGFVQILPYEEQEPTEQTQFKLTYDDNNLYIAVRAFDSNPDSIVKRLSRRDDYDGDWVKVHIDSYHDLLTGYTFAVNAAGVKGDQKITNDDDFDHSWNPIWYVKTSIDAEGWVAEMRIPLTQLRFAKQDSYVWGLQLTRMFFRKGELSGWQFVSENSSGWVHHFGEIHGIKNITPKKQKDLTPYILGKVESYEKDYENPFSTGRDYGGSIGLDGKFGVTNDFTLDFSINPDFGQVEADPSEVNLTTYESYLAEKRSFFIEGKEILNQRLASRDNLFYSRRIGRRPGYSPDLDDDQYINSPENTTIMGAFKLTGKTKGGLSVGVMESVTQKEEAEIATLNASTGNTYDKSKVVVEPLTNYFATRVEKDLNNSNTRLGIMATATNRDIETAEIRDEMHSSAYTGGLNFNHNWKDKTYFLSFNAVVSLINGSKEQMETTQTSSPHWFQRPDANYLSVDTTITSMTGYGGKIEIGKAGNGKWKYSTSVSVRSPKLNLNEMGYIRRNDMMQQNAEIKYTELKPGSFYRSYEFDLEQWFITSMGGEYKSFGMEFWTHVQFTNQWYSSIGVSKSAKYISTDALRGGPSLKNEGFNKFFAYLQTDSRNNFQAGLNLRTGFKDGRTAGFNKIYFNFNYRISDAFKVSIEPGMFNEHEQLTYVTNIDDWEEVRYVRANLNKIETELVIRFTYNLTPDFTIQYYGMPFISAGNYTDFKYITSPMANNFDDRFYQYADNQIQYNAEDEVYQIDENLDDVVDYSFDNPNYNSLEFNSNLVLRWEYSPGSTFYFVWSQQRSKSDSSGNYSLNEDAHNLFVNTYPRDVLLMKFSYRFGL